LFPPHFKCCKIWPTEGIFKAIFNIQHTLKYIPAAFLRSGSDTDYGRSDKQLPPPPNSSNSSSVPSCPYDRQLEQPAAAPGSPPGLGLVACVGRQFESPYATTDILAAQSQYRRHKVGFTKYSRQSTIHFILNFYRSVRCKQISKFFRTKLR
jgi:hypothetical protein